MRRAHTDNDTGLADLQTARAVHDADVGYIEFFVRLRAQAFHFAKGHRRVGLVNQVERAAAFGPFARITIESHGRAALRVTLRDGRQRRRRLDRWSVRRSQLRSRCGRDVRVARR